MDMDVMGACIYSMGRAASRGNNRNFQFSYCKTVPKAYPVFNLQKRSILIGTNSVDAQTVALLEFCIIDHCIKDDSTVSTILLIYVKMP